MADRENMDNFFEARYQTAKRLYDNDDGRYESVCLQLLADPALPLHRRAICCYMVARRFEHHRFYTQHGLETLSKIETLIQEGRVADRLAPWIASTRTRFEDLRSEIKTALEEYEAGESTEQEIEDAEGEEIVTGADAGAETASVSTNVVGHGGSSSSIVQQSEGTSIPLGATSTQQTSIAAEPVERTTSPPLHPAVQQMEDDADMLFGDHTSYESMTPEEQAAWRASAPERLRKRMREEEDNGKEEHAAKK